MIVLLSLCLLIIVIVSYFFDTAGQSSFDISRSAHIKIIEVMTNNSSALINRDGIVADYAIIHNNSDTDINLDGWGLSDRPYEIRYSFSDCILEAGASKFVFFPGKGNSNSGVGELYTTFGLSSSANSFCSFRRMEKLLKQSMFPRLEKMKSIPSPAARGKLPP